METTTQINGTGTFKKFDGEWLARVPESVQTGDVIRLVKRGGEDRTVQIIDGCRLTETKPWRGDPEANPEEPTGFVLCSFQDGGKTIHLTAEGRAEEAAARRGEARDAGRARMIERLTAEDEDED